MGFNLPILNRTRRKGGFDWYPGVLYQPGDILLWYDPSDLTTMFQDVAGTSPVTADGQSVLLMLDKGQWGGKTLTQVLAAQPELVTNGDFATGDLTGFTSGGGWAVSGGEVTLNSNNGAFYLNPTVSSANLRVLSFDLTRVTIGSVDVRGTGPAFNVIATFSTPGSYTVYILPGVEINFLRSSTTFNGAIDNVSVKEIPGYHRVQATPSQAPKYKTDGTLHWLLYDGTDDGSVTPSVNFLAAVRDGSARKNMIVNSTFSGAVSGTPGTIPSGWTSGGTAGTLTYDPVGGSGTGSLRIVTDTERWLVTQSFNAEASTNYTFSTVVDVATSVPIWQLIVPTAVPSGAVITYYLDGVLVTGASATGTGVHTLEARIAVDTTPGSIIVRYGSGGQSNVTADVTFYDPQFEVGEGRTSYQIIGSDEVAICAGVTKSSDAAAAMFAELSATSGSNNGTFALITPGAAAANYTWRSKGSTDRTVNLSPYASPLTSVLTGIGDISANRADLRVNGVLDAGTPLGSAGTGNFGNYPLYFGRRGGTTFPFNGKEHQTVIRSRLLSASELAKLETFTAAKTGVIL